MARKNEFACCALAAYATHPACIYLASLSPLSEAHAEVALGSVHCGHSRPHCQPVPVSTYRVCSEAACHPHLVIAAGPEPFEI